MYLLNYRSPAYAALLVILLLLTGTGNSVYAQKIFISGRITDAASKKPLSYVNVFIPGSSIGTSTDDKGYYQLQADSGAYAGFAVSFLGYKTVSKPISGARTQTIDVKLESDAKVLNEVVVRSGRRKRYRNKDNPAVELIHEVIAHKAGNRMQSYDFIEYEQYEKIQMSLSNTAEKLR